jgi:nitroreductase
MTQLQLTTDELLTTTRAVRKRLDLTRSVDRRTIEECLALAQQAPQAGNRQLRQFVVVTGSEQRLALAEIYRRALQIGYEGPPPREPSAAREIAERHRGEQSVEQYLRILDSVIYLYDHLHEVPVHVIPCVSSWRITPETPARGFQTVGAWGSVIQSTWSFMLAARSRGLGTAWTTATLMFERDVADLLAIPYDDFMQAGLIPVAYTKGTDFKAGPREPVASVVHWDKWEITT